MMFFLLIMVNGIYHYSVRRERMFPKKDRRPGMELTNGRPCSICGRGIYDHPAEHWGIGQNPRPAYDSSCPFRYVSSILTQGSGSGDQ